MAKTKTPEFKHPFFGYLFIDHRFVADDDPLKEHLDNTSAMFDFLIDFLREGFPNRHVNQLCTLAWRLIGNRIVNLAQMQEVNPPTLSFIAIGKGPFVQPMILLPHTWAKDVVDEPNRTMPLGSIIMAASQSRDFVNNKLLTKDAATEASKRAKMYEAEMLLTLQGFDPFKPNEYQTEVLKRYPRGVESAPELVYQGAEFYGAS